MYGTAHRRPWSPEPRHDDYDLPYEPYDQHYEPWIPRRSREPSDPSVEALDLADYAATLRRPPRFEPYSRYPPSLAPVLSNHSLPLSRHSLPSSSAASSSRHHTLPPPSPVHTRPGHTSLGDNHSTPSGPTTEVDISHFPPWARTWYDQPARPRNARSSDPFDPNYTRYDANIPPTLTPSRHPYAYESIHPWDDGALTNPPSYSNHGPTPIDPETKEARIRLLEREFNLKEDEKVFRGGEALVPGTVDERGHLVTRSPKKRTFTRWAQILLSLAAGIPAIYAAVAIKPNPPAPPAGKPAVYVLYVLPCLTTVLLLYMFVIRPCCGGRRKRRKGAMQDPLGAMVLPVGEQGKKEKKHKKGKGAAPGGDVQVNLIVDPAMFKEPDDTSTEEEDMIPGGYDASSKRKRRKAKRRSVFAGLALEADWRLARAWLKKITAVDAVAMILWGGVFVFILIGKRCPAGKFNGWCDAYNVSTAASCLLCLAFGFSLFFDVQDLHISKVSPRTR